MALHTVVAMIVALLQPVAHLLLLATVAMTEDRQLLLHVFHVAALHQVAIAHVVVLHMVHLAEVHHSVDHAVAQASAVATAHAAAHHHTALLAADLHSEVHAAAHHSVVAADAVEVLAVVVADAAWESTSTHLASYLQLL
jgi:hypothetical protein